MLMGKASASIASRPSESPWSSGMEHPLLSIGIPVYNSEDCIGKAIESVQAQTYRNVEIVISDNCSTDRTREICLAHAAKDHRIRYYRNRTDIGKEPNFLRVLQLATGDFFMWNCADDVRPPGSLESLMAAMVSSPQAVMALGPVVAEAIGSTRVLDNRMNAMNDHPSERIRAFVKGVEHNAIQYGVFKKNVLTRAYVTSNFIASHYGHDYHLCLQTCLLGPVAYSPTPMIIYREKGIHPTLDPMGQGKPVTLWNLLTGGKAILKVWITLLHGCVYLLRPSEVTLSNRIGSLCAFGSAFVARYRGRLVKDAILVSGFPLRWPLSRAWPLAKRSPLLLTLSRKFKARTISP